MAWEPYRGRFGLRHYAKTASQVFTAGALTDVVSGYIVVAAITSQSHMGVIQRTVLATDSDYASTTVLPLMIPQTPTSQWRVSVLSTDTAAVGTDEGNFFDLGGSPVGIDVTNATSADDAFVCDKVISANVVVGVLNSYKGTAPGIGSAI